MSKEENKSDKINGYQVVSRINRLGMRYPSMYWVAVFLGISLSGIAIIRPYLSIQAVDLYILEKDIIGLNKVVLWMGVALLFEILFQFGFIYLSEKLAFRVVHDMRTKLFSHITSLSHSFFDKNPVGQLITRLVSDLESVASMFGQGLFMIVADLLKLIIIVVVMLSVNVPLSIGVFMVLPFLVFATRYFQKKMKVAFDMVRKEVSKLNTFVQERLNGINIIQSFAREDEEVLKFQAINGRHRDAHLKTVWHFSVFLPVIELFSSLTLGIIIYYAGIFNPKEISAGELVAFVSFTQMMFRPIRQIADKINQIQHGVVASGRVLKLMDREPNILFTGKLTTPIKGKLDFEHIDFSYNDKEQVLRDVSFSINAGEKLGVVGETGAGKSSIVSLLMQNYRWNNGDIRLDDQSVTEYDIDYLRQKMAYAQQDVFLFDDTIWENITMGQDISREKVEQAITDLNLQAFIDAQPQGLETSVGEKGNALSAGEKQLVAFLRIYLRNPQLLVLDEATSSIDSITEQYVQTAIAKMTEERTSIIIAHRLSTLSLCDKIMVMTKGEVENIGTHEELIEKSETYRRLYQMQFDMTG